MLSKRIAFLIDSFPNYTETFIINQITNLIDLGYDIKIFSRKFNRNIRLSEKFLRYGLLDKHKCYKEDIQIPDNKLDRTKQAIKVFFNNPPIRKAIIKALNPLKHGKKALSLRNVFYVGYFSDCLDPFDVVHAHYGPNGKEILKLQKIGILRSKKTLVTFHGYDLHDYQPEFYSDLFCSNYTYTVNTEYSKRKLLQLGAKTPVTILPMGLDEKFLKEQDSQKINNEQLTILTVARLVPVKGIAYCIRAMKIIADKGYHVKYLIIGDGELKGDLQKMIGELELNSSVILLGAKKTEEVFEIYKQANIFLLSSIRTHTGVQEAQGLVIQEAQAMGIPVVVTDTGGIKEGMLDSESGFVVPEKNPEAIAEKMIQLIEDKNLRIKFGRKGREFVKKKYDNRALVQKLVSEVYES